MIASVRIGGGGPAADRRELPCCRGGRRRVEQGQPILGSGKLVAPATGCPVQCGSGSNRPVRWAASSKTPWPYDHVGGGGGGGGGRAETISAGSGWAVAASVLAVGDAAACSSVNSPLRSISDCVATVETGRASQLISMTGGVEGLEHGDRLRRRTRM